MTPIVMALGGWKSEKMMRRCAAVTDQTLRAAAEAVRGGRSYVGRDLETFSPAPMKAVAIAAKARADTSTTVVASVTS
jgi:hypothetical protein